MDLKTIFKRLGFPKHSDVVFDLLSRSKEQLLVSEIARRMQLARVSVYRCLEALLQEGLVSQSDAGRRTYYTANSPRKLKELMRVTEDACDTEIAQHITEREKDVPQSVHFLYGPEGVRAAFNDVIERTTKGNTFFRYTSERDLAKVNHYLARDYRERRDKKKLERLVISNAVSGSQKRSRLERFVKFIPSESDQFEQNIIELIYGDRVSIIDLSKEEVMIIENKQLADFQKVIFKLLYKQLPR